MKSNITKKEENGKKRIIMETVLAILTVILIAVSITLLAENSNKKDEISKLQLDYSRLKDENDTIISNLKEQVNKKEKEISEIKQEEKQKELNDNIETLETKVSNLTKSKENLEKEVESLKEDIIRIKGEEKTYPAGQFTAGKDVAVGRYKIFEGNSNFTVHSSTGRLMVNIILGNDNYSVSEYIYTFKDGDQIESRSPFKIVEVE